MQTIPSQDPAFTVSLILPVYQVSDYIERCIQSVLHQTYPQIECIVVDDASADDSMDRCEKLIQEYAGPIRFKVLHHPSNRGISAARNTGTEAATGDYLFYLDSDDEVTPDCIETLATLAKEHPDCEIIMGNYMRHENGATTLLYKDQQPLILRSKEEVSGAFLRAGLSICAWNKLIKRTFIQQHHLFFIEGIVYEDTIWAHMVFQNLSKLYVSKHLTYHYYIHPNSIVTSTKKRTIGKSFAITYSIFLRNLSPGREKKELGYYLNDFCVRYTDNRKTIPEYGQLMNEYRSLSWKHKGFLQVLLLDTTRLLHDVPAGPFFIKKLMALRRRSLRFFRNL